MNFKIAAENQSEAPAAQNPIGIYNDLFNEKKNVSTPLLGADDCWNPNDCDCDCVPT